MYKNTPSYDDISAVFHLPQAAAAKTLGIGLSPFKRTCHQLGIERWPYRKLLGVDTKLAELNGIKKRSTDPVEIAQLDEKIVQLTTQKSNIYEELKNAATTFGKSPTKLRNSDRVLSSTVQQRTISPNYSMSMQMFDNTNRKTQLPSMPPNKDTSNSTNQINNIATPVINQASYLQQFATAQSTTTAALNSVHPSSNHPQLLQLPTAKPPQSRQASKQVNGDHQPKLNTIKLNSSKDISTTNQGNNKQANEGENMSGLPPVFFTLPIDCSLEPT